jgi:hypothetical protein
MPFAATSQTQGSDRPFNQKHLSYKNKKALITRILREPINVGISVERLLEVDQKSIFSAPSGLAPCNIREPASPKGGSSQKRPSACLSLLRPAN